MRHNMIHGCCIVVGAILVFVATIPFPTNVSYNKEILHADYTIAVSAKYGVIWKYACNNVAFTYGSDGKGVTEIFSKELKTGDGIHLLYPGFFYSIFTAFVGVSLFIFGYVRRGHWGRTLHKQS